MADKKKQKTGPMRLDKFLGEMGYGTRTQIKEMERTCPGKRTGDKGS